METLLPNALKMSANSMPTAPAPTIARLAETYDADLVISATHGRSGLKRLLLGSVTEQLIRVIHRPFLIVTPPEIRMSPHTIDLFAVKKILVGCDFSKDSARAVSYGFSLAQEFQSALHLVHVIEPFVYEDALMPDPMTADIKDDLNAHLNRKLNLLVPDEARNWCNITTVSLAGKPFDELIKYALLHAVDLIILGVRGHGLVETLFLGSTTDRVLRRASCPVLTVAGES
jgi:nucleotide-binding universal stress UspA family protein